MINKFIKEKEAEFEERFTYWVVLGSTLNDGSERRISKLNPEPYKDFIRSALHQYNTLMKKKIEEMRPAQFEGKSEIALIMKGYNQAVDDILKVLKEE